MGLTFDEEDLLNRLGKSLLNRAKTQMDKISFYRKENDSIDTFATQLEKIDQYVVMLTLILQIRDRLSNEI